MSVEPSALFSTLYDPNAFRIFPGKCGSARATSFSMRGDISLGTVARMYARGWTTSTGQGFEAATAAG